MQNAWPEAPAKRFGDFPGPIPSVIPMVRSQSRYLLASRSFCMQRPRPATVPVELHPGMAKAWPWPPPSGTVTRKRTELACQYIGSIRLRESSRPCSSPPMAKRSDARLKPARSTWCAHHGSAVSTLRNIWKSNARYLVAADLAGAISSTSMCEGPRIHRCGRACIPENPNLSCQSNAWQMKQQAAAKTCP